MEKYDDARIHILEPIRKYENISFQAENRAHNLKDCGNEGGTDERRWKEKGRGKLSFWPKLPYCRFLVGNSPSDMLQRCTSTL